MNELFRVGRAHLRIASRACLLEVRVTEPAVTPKITETARMPCAENSQYIWHENSVQLLLM